MSITKKLDDYDKKYMKIILLYFDGTGVSEVIKQMV